MPQEVSAAFKNELGNKIKLRVGRAPTEKGAPMLKITLAGPKSISENTITVREGRRLVRAVSQYLDEAE